MSEQTWGRRLGNGALAGIGGGVASAVLLWLLVEPAINRAIAIEKAATEADNTGARAHGAGATAHEHADVVSRLAQQIGGTFTVVLVAVLLALAYSVVYARSSHRLPGITALGRSLSLAALAFGVMALMPALVLPANPPAVGDPDTVGQRTLAYLQVVLLSVLAVGIVFAVQKALADRRIAAEWRWLGTAAVAVAGVAVVLLVAPDGDQQIPSAVPAALIWEFRVGSLAQLAAMWAGIGIVHGALAHRAMSSRRSATDLPLLV